MLFAYGVMEIQEDTMEVQTLEKTKSSLKRLESLIDVEQFLPELWRAAEDEDFICVIW